MHGLVRSADEQAAHRDAPARGRRAARGRPRPTARASAELVDDDRPGRDLQPRRASARSRYSWAAPGAHRRGQRARAPSASARGGVAAAGAHRAAGPRACRRRAPRSSVARTARRRTRRRRSRPISPYGAAKAYAHQMAGIYRARGLHVATCILYNHESPRRPTDVRDPQDHRRGRAHRAGAAATLALGNLDVRRDWGWAPDYVDAMIRAARHPVADDFVIATGRDALASPTSSRPRSLHAGIADWETPPGDRPALRPAGRRRRAGRATRRRPARCSAGRRRSSFEELVGRMVDHDLALLRGER